MYQPPDDGSDLPVGAVVEFDLLANCGVRRLAAGERAVSDLVGAPFGQGQTDSRREELDIVEGQGGDLFGAVTGGGDEQDAVGVQVEVVGVELPHQPPHEQLLGSRRIDGAVGSFDASRQLRWPTVRDGKVVADVERADVLVCETEQQVGDVGPAMFARVTPSGGCSPSFGYAGLQLIGRGPGRAGQGAFVRSGELVDFLGAAPGDSDFAVDQPAQLRCNGSAVVVCASGDHRPDPGRQHGRCSGARSMAAGQGSLPFGQYCRDVGVLPGQARLVGLVAEQRIDLVAEVAHRSATDRSRSARQRGELGVLDPLVRQLAGQRRASELTGVERDFPHRAAPIRCPDHADTDPVDWSVRLCARREFALVFAAAGHQRSLPSVSMCRAMSA